MLNEKYYEGFEGEPEVKIYTKENTGFRCWIGYLENLFSGCYNAQIAKDGLLHCYQTCEGFYEEETWRLPNISMAIEELKLFDEKRADITSYDILQQTKFLKEDLLAFLDTARVKNFQIYVEYD